jgi:predicted phosphodiesterase
MRALVISDLHANWPALEAVLAAESFDRLLVVGDLVSYGPHAPEVVECVKRQASLAVRGNHDDALARWTDCRCAPSSKPLAEATQARHREQLTPGQIAFLGESPTTASTSLDGHTLLAVHASPRDHLYRYTLTPGAAEQHLAEETGDVEAEYYDIERTVGDLWKLRVEEEVTNRLIAILRAGAG